MMDDSLSKILSDPESRTSLRTVLTVVMAHGVLSSTPSH